MFIDESGEANTANVDIRFNIFVLCGILFSEESYKSFDNDLKALKIKHFGSDKVIFHSIKMRSKKGAFTIFQNENVLHEFYRDIEVIFTRHKYTVISCIVNKDKYRYRYPDKNHAYEEALKFMCERCVLYMSRQNVGGLIHICLEKRQRQKDAALKKYYTHFIENGTGYFEPHKFKVCHPKLEFRAKEQNINGLQFADLCAYPIARRELSPTKRQPTFELFENKIYCNIFGEYIGYGIKHFP
jgi:hypothetical protein